LMDPKVSPFFEQVEEPVSGDMVGFGDQHVGLVTDPQTGEMIHASSKAEVVRYGKYNAPYWERDFDVMAKFYRFSPEKFREYKNGGGR